MIKRETNFPNNEYSFWPWCYLIVIDIRYTITYWKLQYVNVISGGMVCMQPSIVNKPSINELAGSSQLTLDRHITAFIYSLTNSVNRLFRLCTQSPVQAFNPSLQLSCIEQTHYCVGFVLIRTRFLFSFETQLSVTLSLIDFRISRFPPF